MRHLRRMKSIAYTVALLPNFTWAIFGADNSNGDVLNPFFNNVKLNDGGIGGPVGTQVGRYGRIQLRYSF